jgi:putative transposase
MGSVGDAYDNVLCASFFAMLKCELLDRRRFATHLEARLAVFEFIEGWYNPTGVPPGAGLMASIGTGPVG